MWAKLAHVKSGSQGPTNTSSLLGEFWGGNYLGFAGKIHLNLLFSLKAMSG